MSEQMWMERAQSAEARLATLAQAKDALLERVRVFKDNFGIKEKGSGELEIDFDKFACNLGEENAIALIQILEQTYGLKKAS